MHIEDYGWHFQFDCDEHFTSPTELIKKLEKERPTLKNRDRSILVCYNSKSLAKVTMDLHYIEMFSWSHSSITDNSISYNELSYLGDILNFMKDNIIVPYQKYQESLKETFKFFEDLN